MEHIADIIRIGYLYYQSDSLSQKSIRIADTVVDQLIHFQHPMFARRKTQLQQLLNRIQTLTFGIARALDVLRVIFRVEPLSQIYEPRPENGRGYNRTFYFEPEMCNQAINPKPSLFQAP